MKAQRAILEAARFFFRYVYAILVALMVSTIIMTLIIWAFLWTLNLDATRFLSGAVVTQWTPDGWIPFVAAFAGILLGSLRLD